MAERTITRRTLAKTIGAAGFLSLTGIDLLGCSTEAGDFSSGYPQCGRPAPEAYVDPQTGEVTVNEDISIRYSACLGCYNCCGNSVHIDRKTGEIIRSGGNPYNATCAEPFLSFEAPLEEAYRSNSFANNGGNSPGTICERGLGSLDAYNQPNRITTPLKRAGARGEGKWEAISWDQLIREVTEGGKLFAHIGEDREVEGFIALHDTETPLNPDQPDLGPVSNQVVGLGGRGDGRSVIADRFYEAYGTKNQYYHAATCGGALMYTTSKTGTNIRADLDNAEYVLWCGTFPGTTGSAANGHAGRCVKGLVERGTKMDIFDPVLASGLATPTQPNVVWHPIRTATNPAFALGLVRWIIENDAYNKEYLSYPNHEAAYAGGFNSITNATYLVIVDEDHPNFRKLLRAEDIGIENPLPTEEDGVVPDCFVVIDAKSGKPTIHPLCTQGLIDFEGEVSGIKVRSSFLFTKDAAFEKTMQDWSEICDVPVATLEATAKEFTSHGTRACAVGMGSTANMNGLDSACMYDMLHSMIGSACMQGGANWRPSSAGTSDGARYLLGSIEGAPAVGGVPMSRSGKNYCDTDEYRNRIAAGEVDPKPKLPWYSIPRNTDNQCLAGIVHQYPYQAKILVTWMFASIHSTPGANRESFIDALKDTSIIPLHICCDVFMGTFATYADYFVPDTTPYESWGIFEAMTLHTGYSDSVRWPVVEPRTDILPDGRHASFEAFLCDVAQACDVPGYGERGIKDVEGNYWPFKDASDFFVKGVANVAYDRNPVSDASSEDIRLQMLDQLPEEWQAAVKPEEWPKVQNVLSRGGRFYQKDEMFDDRGRCVYPNTYTIHFYSEKRAGNIYSMTGEHSYGEMRYNPERLADLTPLEDRFPRSEWPFKSTNYKPRFRSVCKLSNSPIMRDLCPSNYLEINIEDAAQLGIKDGDLIRIENPTGDVMEGPAMVRAGVAKGTFAVAFGYAQIALGNQVYEIDGGEVAADPAIGAGIHLQTMLDPTVEAGNFPVSDPEAAVPGRSGGVYKIMKA